jgi:4-hydroxyacetophenone monooxygenase
MIGTGASGMQVAPTIAPDVGHLVIFQRSPHWITSNPNYHRAVSDGKKWALKNIPYYAEWYRFQLWWASADSLHSSLKVDPSWPHPDRSLNEKNESMRRLLIDAIGSQVGDDPELLEKVVPKYPPYGKRMLRDNHWYSMLKRDNVELVTDPIEKISQTAVHTANGNSYSVDAIVMATGFSVGHVLGPIRVSGSGGRSLREIWGDDDPRAFLGITVPRFPNMFILYGPNTNLAHGGSAMFHTECQVAYALQGIRILLEGDLAALDCKQDVHDEYNARVDAAHAGMVWTHRGVNSWYKNRAGRVFATSPWRLVDYWHFTHDFHADDYNWVRMPPQI